MKRQQSGRLLVTFDTARNNSATQRLAGERNYTPVNGIFCIYVPSHENNVQKNWNYIPLSRLLRLVAVQMLFDLFVARFEPNYGRPACKIGNKPTDSRAKQMIFHMLAMANERDAH